jgi:hypothetical protein
VSFVLPERAGGHDVAPDAPSADRVVLAAEWVGFIRSHGPGSDVVRFAPGGCVHAYDQATGTVLCGANVNSLEIFRTGFSGETTGFNCDVCVRLAAALAIASRVADEDFDS